MSRHVEALLTDEEAGLLDFLRERWQRDEQTTIRAAIAAATAVAAKGMMDEAERARATPNPADAMLALDRAADDLNRAYNAMARGSGIMRSDLKDVADGFNRVMAALAALRSAVPH